MIDRYDLLGGFGLALVAAGLVWVWWPLALIVPGVVLLALGILGAMRQPPPDLAQGARGETRAKAHGKRVNKG